MSTTLKSREDSEQQLITLAQAHLDRECCAAFSLPMADGRVLSVSNKLTCSLPFAESGQQPDAAEIEVDAERAAILAAVIKEQESHRHAVTQVFFRAGLIACREYMARFVAADSPTIAASIRANWWPSLGSDLGAPRLMEWSELTEGEYGEPGFRCKSFEEVSPTLEALPIALKFLNLSENATPTQSTQQPDVHEREVKS